MKQLLVAFAVTMLVVSAYKIHQRHLRAEIAKISAEAADCDTQPLRDYVADQLTYCAGHLRDCSDVITSCTTELRECEGESI